MVCTYSDDSVYDKQCFVAYEYDTTLYLLFFEKEQNEGDDIMTVEQNVCRGTINSTNISWQ